MDLRHLPERLPKPVNPFFFLARYMELQEYDEGEEVRQATAARNHLVALGQQHDYRTDDPHKALFIAGCAINLKQRQTVMSVCEDQDALDLIWALDEQGG